jgi:hypothetical protein
MTTSAVATVRDRLRDGKDVELAGILHLTGATNITAALRHLARRPQRALQTLKTR